MASLGEKGETEIRHINPVSIAKVLAFVYGGIGLIYSIIFSLVFGFLGFTAGGQISIQGGFNVFSAIVALVFFPLAFALFGAIAGFVVGSLYNFAAKKVGGIKIRF